MEVEEVGEGIPHMDLVRIAVNNFKDALNSNKYTNITKAATTVLAYIKNLYTHPQEPKYRCIPTTNKTFQNNVFWCTEALELLYALGFVHKNTSLVFQMPTVEVEQYLVLRVLESAIQEFSALLKEPKSSDPPPDMAVYPQLSTETYQPIEFEKIWKEEREKAWMARDKEKLHANRINTIGSNVYDDVCIGTLLGCCIGDIFGASVDMWTSKTIMETYKELLEFKSTDYTEVSAMTLALAMSLMENKKLEARHVSYKYVEIFHMNPNRKYSNRTKEVFFGITERRLDYNKSAQHEYQESVTSGGSLHVAPIALTFRHAGEGVFQEAIKGALLCVHIHPEVIDAAYIQAKAISDMCKLKSPEELEPVQWLKGLANLATTPSMRDKILKLVILLEKLAQHPGTPDVNFTKFVSPPLHSCASESVSCALWFFCRYFKNPVECLIKAVNAGGKTSNVGSIVGSLLGATYGTSWIPKIWFDKIENAEYGRDLFIKVATEISHFDWFYYALQSNEK